MAEYVTLIEAAELEDVKYNTMVRRITRNPDKFDTMTEKSENGGKDAVLVAVASLSKKARNAWKERAKLKELSGTISPEGDAQPEPEAQRVRYFPEYQAGGQTGDQEHMVQRRLCGKPWNP